MTESHFFAMISRMKYIERWALMRNSIKENLSEHSLEVAMIAHVLATLNNVRLGGSLDADRAALIGLYHDSAEIITGDMPTPIKYYNPQIKEAFHAVEDVAGRRLIALLPEDLQEIYRPIFFKEEEDAYLWKLVKAADKLSALIKCIEEEKNGNKEFLSAKRALEGSLKRMQLPEADMFVEEFLPSYYKTLDELNE
ncbi:MAG: 5'-deoxynucleotidase [Lachnospiraceae bacterium]|nr:5'-deoxynucleotidase [Lachnospiraceae bacterium]MBR0154263.1 5'-deoxynucleotidase [Lachnospiraceae bacterium]